MDSRLTLREACCTLIWAGTWHPQTGILKASAGGGLGELTVENGTDSDGVVALVVNEKAVASAYIRPGGSITLRGIRDGTYGLYFGTRSGWDRSRFSLDARLQRFEETFSFTTTASSYSVWSVTLHGVVGGTAGAEEVPPEEFPSIGP